MPPASEVEPRWETTPEVCRQLRKAASSATVVRGRQLRIHRLDSARRAAGPGRRGAGSRSSRRPPPSSGRRVLAPALLRHRAPPLPAQLGPDHLADQAVRERRLASVRNSGSYRRFWNTVSGTPARVGRVDGLQRRRGVDRRAACRRPPARRPPRPRGPVRRARHSARPARRGRGHPSTSRAARSGPPAPGRSSPPGRPARGWPWRPPPPRGPPRQERRVEPAAGAAVADEADPRRAGAGGVMGPTYRAPVDPSASVARRRVRLGGQSRSPVRSSTSRPPPPPRGAWRGPSRPRGPPLAQPERPPRPGRRGRTTTAGTSRLRTTRVSSRTPKATMNAICARKRIGSTARAENVDARTMPALVMTPPVTARPTRMPGRVPRIRDSSRTRVMRKIE